MQCTNPKKAGFDPVQKTLSFSSKTYNNPKYQIIQLPCRKCIACKLEKARETAIRCVHETKTQDPENCHFVTLTYSDKHLGENTLEYRDIQLFIKKLRKQQQTQWLQENYPRFYELTKNDFEIRKRILKKTPKIKYLVGGEYGEKNHRKHWHILLFNVCLKDLVSHSTNEKGDTYRTSKTIDTLWGYNDSEECPTIIGRVTIESAGYVARYTCKKFGDKNTIGRRSTRNAIGKEFIEKYHDDIFNYGKIDLIDLTSTTIPRYYKNWLQKNHPEKFETFQNTILKNRQESAKLFDEIQRKEYFKACLARSQKKGLMITRNEQRKIKLKQQFKKLHEHLKF